MDSREKVFALRNWLRGVEPDDEASAQQLQMLIALLPLVTKAVPEDPEELDRYLRMVSWGSAQCRSDDAPALGVFELLEGEWVKVDLAAEEEKLEGG